MWKMNSLKLVTSKECCTCAYLCTCLRKALQYTKTCWVFSRVFSRFSFCVVTITLSMNYFQSELSPRAVWMMFIQDWRLNRLLQLFSQSLQDQCLSTFLGVHISIDLSIYLSIYAEKTVAQAKCYPAKHEPPPSPQQPSPPPKKKDSQHYFLPE